MGTEDRENQLKEDFAPLLAEMGFRIVELHAANVSGRTHLDLVIYSAGGVSIDDCAAVHKLVMPRAEIILDDRDVAVQVASPGIDRVFKDHSEFAVFQGRGVSVLVRGSDEWLGGVVEATTGDEVTLATREEKQTVAFSDIQKARLDFSQEVSTDHGR